MRVKASGRREGDGSGLEAGFHKGDMHEALQVMMTGSLMSVCLILPAVESQKVLPATWACSKIENNQAADGRREKAASPGSVPSKDNEWQDSLTLQEPIPVDTFLQPPLI